MRYKPTIQRTAHRVGPVVGYADLKGGLGPLVQYSGIKGNVLGKTDAGSEQVRGETRKNYEVGRERNKERGKSKGGVTLLFVWS